MKKKPEDIALGLRIKELRANLNMDQKTFAHKIGSTVSALSNWENGRNKPNDIMINNIAKIGGTTYEYVLFGDFKSRIQKILLSYSDVDSTLIQLVINGFENKKYYYPIEGEIIEDYNHLLDILNRERAKNNSEKQLGVNLHLAKNKLSEHLESLQNKSNENVLHNILEHLNTAEAFYEELFNTDINILSEENKSK